MICIVWCGVCDLHAHTSLDSAKMLHHSGGTVEKTISFLFTTGFSMKNAISSRSARVIGVKFDEESKYFIRKICCSFLLVPFHSFSLWDTKTAGNNQKIKYSKMISRQYFQFKMQRRFHFWHFYVAYASLGIEMRVFRLSIFAIFQTLILDEQKSF